jgi:hypothetical protein
MPSDHKRRTGTARKVAGQRSKTEECLRTDEVVIGGVKVKMSSDNIKCAALNNILCISNATAVPLASSEVNSLTSRIYAGNQPT